MRTNKRLRKSPTSSVLDGPPILRNTIAVGPFDPVASWVTGGTGVAKCRAWAAIWGRTSREDEFLDTLFKSGCAQILDDMIDDVEL